MQQIGAFSGFIGVELGIGSASLLLALEFFGTVIPIDDFFGQPIFHSSLGLGDEFELAATHFCQMFRHHVGDGITLRFLLQFAIDPLAFRPIENDIADRFVCRQGPVVQIRCVIDVAGDSIGIHFNVEHALGNDAAFAGTGDACVLNSVLKVEQHAWRGTGVAFIHQHGATSEQVTVTLQGEVNDGVEQQMSRADEGGQRLALRRYQ